MAVLSYMHPPYGANRWRCYSVIDSRTIRSQAGHKVLIARTFSSKTLKIRCQRWGQQKRGVETTKRCTKIKLNWTARIMYVQSTSTLLLVPHIHFETFVTLTSEIVSMAAQAYYAAHYIFIFLSYLPITYTSRDP